MTNQLQEQINKSMLEKDFQTMVIDAAHVYGWMVAHFRTAQGKAGRYMTPVQGDGAGYPDLTMVKGDRLIFAELKKQGGKLSLRQSHWIECLQRVKNGSDNKKTKRQAIGVFVWYPSDWSDIIDILK